MSIFSTEEVKKKALILKFPKMNVENKKRRRAGTVIHCDYLKVSVSLCH